MPDLKTYFLLPGWDFPAGSITLGSIITDPMQPQLTLFKPRPDDIDSPIRATTKAQVFGTFGIGREHDGKPGLFHTFISLFGLGNEDNFLYDRKGAVSYTFRALDTHSFEPSREFKSKAISQAVRAARVLPTAMYRESVYMITSIKSIRGAGVTTKSSREVDWQVSLNVDLLEHEQRGTGAGVRDGQPVVFAFGVIELELKPQTGVGSSHRRSRSIDTTTAESHDADLQRLLTLEFGEGAFAVIGGYDEEDDEPCRLVAPTLACVDLMSAVPGQRRSLPRGIPRR